MNTVESLVLKQCSVRQYNKPRCDLKLRGSDAHVGLLFSFYVFCKVSITQ